MRPAHLSSLTYSMRISRPLLAATLLLIAGACRGVSDAAAPEATLASIDPASVASATGTHYVLRATTSRSGAPVPTVDITCDSVRTVVSVHDTLTLRADGTARRSAHTRFTRNGRLVQEGSVVNSGTWTTYTTSPYAYYDQGPGIVLALGDGTGGEYRWYLRGGADGQFTSRMAMGAMCSPSAVTTVPDAPRHEEFRYHPAR